MHDMLVKLYDLPEEVPFSKELRDEGITLRKPIGPEKNVVVEWVKDKFNKAWSSETEIAITNKPVTCFVAIKNKKIIGFANYDATALGFFGPTGVVGQFRNKGIGAALLLASLYDMRNKGYGYAIIGGVGPAEYYRKVVGAVDIADSSPGLWKTWVQG